MRSERENEGLKTAKNILVWIVAIFAIGMMIFTIISVTTFDRADRKLFGYSAFIVMSDSMSATDFDAGDLVLIKETDPSTLKVGDIIAFQSPDEANYGEIVTHKSAGKNRKSLCRKGLLDLGKTQKTQNANRMLTVFPKSE